MVLITSIKSMEIKISNRNNLPWRKGWLRVGKRKQNSFFLGLRYQIQYWCASNTTNKCKQNETFWSNILESRWWGRWSRPYYTYNLKVFEIRSWDCQCFLIHMHNIVDCYPACLWFGLNLQTCFVWFDFEYNLEHWWCMNLTNTPRILLSPKDGFGNAMLNRYDKYNTFLDKELLCWKQIFLKNKFEILFLYYYLNVIGLSCTVSAEKSFPSSLHHTHNAIAWLLDYLTLQ